MACSLCTAGAVRSLLCEESMQYYTFTCCFPQLIYNYTPLSFSPHHVFMHVCTYTDYDCVLHVNPYITNRGLAMVFNPTSHAITKNISLPLYYTGISNKALVMQEGSAGTTYDLARDYTISLPIKMEPMTITWYLIHSAD